ncbi:MAG: hypothetical protein ACWA5K_01110 [bacterium]
MKIRAGIVAVVFALIAAAESFSGEVTKETNDTTVSETKADAPRCLLISRIRNIDVLDSQTLLFRMRGGPDYVNHLPRRCSGITHNPILHETRIERYCNLDTISVIDTTTRMKINTCALGEFEEYVELDDPAD